MGYTILVAEDDEDIKKILKMYIESGGHRVITARDGMEAYELVQNNDIDLALLDVMMPKMDGFTLTEKIRQIKKIPIMLLTAKSADEDKVLGLNIGADDYITKPFNSLEILARVNANLRRSYQFDKKEDEPHSSVITLKELSLDTDRMILTKNGEEIVLTPNEFKLLSFMMKSPGRIYTKSQLCEAVNGEFYDNYENAIVVLILILVLWLKHMISKPLNILGENISGYNIGVNVENEYRGPKEFVGILDAFSKLSVRLSESEAERKRLENEKQKMLADISHDLKTPVSVINGYATALMDGTIPADEQKQYIATIQKRSEMLNELINNFYEYNKLEHPDFKLDLQSVDILNYFRDYLADEYTELDTSGFQIEADIPEKHVMCMVDKNQLKRVFSNIIGNTVKYNKSGTQILFAAEIFDQSVSLIIADSGTGIPKDAVSSIFEPFVVGEKARTGNGSGLGLSIAKKIVTAHGGTITLSTDDHNVYVFIVSVTLEPYYNRRFYKKLLILYGSVHCCRKSGPWMAKDNHAFTQNDERSQMAVFHI